MDLHQLLKQIDYERLAGSAGEKKARTIFKGHLSSWGLEFREDEFEMNAFETGTAKVFTDSNEFSGLPLGLVKSITLSGELCFVENSEHIFCQKGMYKDKIILTFTRNAALADRLKDEGVLAVIYISQPYKDLSANNLRQKSYEEGAVPAMFVSYEDAKLLSRQHGSSVKLEIKQTVKKKKAYNLVVDIPGTGKDKTLTCLCAHYDTVATSHGCNDNGAGSVVLLKIAEYFSKNPPLRDLRIIFFSGEEMGLLGSYAYTEKNKEELKSRMGMLINVDVSGDDLGVDSFICLGSNEIKGYVDGIFKEEGLIFNKRLDIYSSDCIPFSVLEIPSVNLMRWGGDATYHIHTKDDVASKVTQRGLESTFMATKILCERLLNSQIYPVKNEIDPSLRDKIEKYVYSASKREPKLEWRKKYEIL